MRWPVRSVLLHDATREATGPAVPPQAGKPVDGPDAGDEKRGEEEQGPWGYETGYET